MENDISLRISASHSDASLPNILSPQTRLLPLQAFQQQEGEMSTLSAPVQSCVSN